MDAAEIVNFRITVSGGRIYTMTAHYNSFFSLFLFILTVGIFLL